ncbi:MAG: hypothetical protein WD044_00015 [Dongiaceae bacterium]
MFAAECCGHVFRRGQRLVALRSKREFGSHVICGQHCLFRADRGHALRPPRDRRFGFGAPAFLSALAERGRKGRIVQILEQLVGILPECSLGRVCKCNFTLLQ